MKRPYIQPLLDIVALPSATMMTSLSIKGTADGEARSRNFFGEFAWDECPEGEEESDDSLF